MLPYITKTLGADMTGYSTLQTVFSAAQFVGGLLSGAPELQSPYCMRCTWGSMLARLEARHTICLRRASAMQACHSAWHMPARAEAVCSPLSHAAHVTCAT